MKKVELSLSLFLVCTLWFEAYGQSDGDLRLNHFGSTGGSSGRLEIYYNFQWGTVCEDSLNTGFVNANVACRQLGYDRVSRYGRTDFFGYPEASSSIPVWLDSVDCSGSESRLASCSHRGYGNVNCDHSSDVAVTCRLMSTSSFDSGSSSAVSPIIGGIIGTMVPLFIIVIFIIVLVCLLICCVTRKATVRNSSHRTARASRPPTTSSVVTNTTTQGNTTYPTQPSGPQQPPSSAYPTQQDPHPNKEPVNPELSAAAPPAYNTVSAYPSPANPSPPTDPNAGSPPGYPTEGQYPPQTY